MYSDIFSLPFHCMKVLTWLTATIMNWRWVGKLRWGKVLPGEPTAVKKLIRGSWWSTKTTDSEKGVELKKSWLLFNPFLERPEEKIRRSNKSSVKLTVPGFVGSVQSKKLSRPSPPWTPKPAPDLSNAKWVRKQLDKTDEERALVIMISRFWELLRQAHSICGKNWPILFPN